MLNKDEEVVFHNLYNRFVELITTGFLEDKINIQNMIKLFKDKFING